MEYVDNRDVKGRMKFDDIVGRRGIVFHATGEFEAFVMVTDEASVITLTDSDMYAVGTLLKDSHLDSDVYFEEVSNCKLVIS